MGLSIHSTVIWVKWIQMSRDVVVMRYSIFIFSLDDLYLIDSCCQWYDNVDVGQTDVLLA